MPAALAPFGLNALTGWLVTVAGCACLAIAFADLARRFPHDDGPYAYTQRAFGPAAAFIVMWCYWVSVWVANAAIAIGVVGYVMFFVPALAASTVLPPLLALALVWVFVLINLRGVRTAGWVQVTHHPAQARAAGRRGAARRHAAADASARLQGAPAAQSGLLARGGERQLDRAVRHARPRMRHDPGGTRARPAAHDPARHARRHADRRTHLHLHLRRAHVPDTAARARRLQCAVRGSVRPAARRQLGRRAGGVRRHQRPRSAQRLDAGHRRGHADHGQAPRVPAGARPGECACRPGARLHLHRDRHEHHAAV